MDETLELDGVRVARAGFDLAEGSIAAEKIWPVGRRCRNRPFEPAARNWAARGQDAGEECHCYRKIEHNRLRHDVLHRLLFALHPDTILHSTVKRFIYL